MSRRSLGWQSKHFEGRNVKDILFSVTSQWNPISKLMVGFLAFGKMVYP